MPVFTGTNVNPDMLIVSINHRNVRVFDLDGPLQVFHQNHMDPSPKQRRTRPSDLAQIMSAGLPPKRRLDKMFSADGKFREFDMEACLCFKALSAES